MGARGAPVAVGTWADDTIEKTATFARVDARYVRLTALTEAGNRGPWSSAAEINVLGSVPAGGLVWKRVLAATVFAHGSAAFGVEVLAGAGGDVGLGCRAGVGSGCAEEAGERGDGFEEQGVRRACWSAAWRARNSAMARRCPAWAASWRTRAARAGFFRVAGPPGVTRRLVAGELGDGFLGAGIVDEVLAGCGGGDEGRGRGVVRGAGQAVGDPVQPGDGVIGEQRLLAPGELEVVAQVGGGFGEVHRLDREPGGDPLIEGGEGAHPQLPAQGRLPGPDP